MISRISIRIIIMNMNYENPMLKERVIIMGSGHESIMVIRMLLYKILITLFLQFLVSVKT